MKAEMNGINEELVRLLEDKNLTISSAESCTGGLFSAFITDVSGASGVFNETIVTYSNEAKIRELGVKEETLNQFGAVSRDVAYQMADGICRRTGADIGVGITGLAGPTGGKTKKPVGTVFVGLNIKGEIRVFHLLINGARDEIREETCRFVFEKLLELI
ncbi:MAG: CinA family protein [Oscillospiraceae bacterium]|nr:CinA family protein [Oscillospiraceae bacterium]